MYYPQKSYLVLRYTIFGLLKFDLRFLMGSDSHSVPSSVIQL